MLGAIAGLGLDVGTLVGAGVAVAVFVGVAVGVTLVVSFAGIEKLLLLPELPQAVNNPVTIADSNKKTDSLIDVFRRRNIMLRPKQTQIVYSSYSRRLTS